MILDDEIKNAEIKAIDSLGTAIRKDATAGPVASYFSYPRTNCNTLFYCIVAT